MITYTDYTANANKLFVCQEKKDKVNQFLALLQDPDIKPVLNLYLEGFLATSELKILKRLAALEQVLGLNNMDLSDEHELTIPEQLNILAARIDNTQVVNKPPVEPENSPVTKTENRAFLLVEKLKSLRSKKHLDSTEIIQFLKYGIDERFRAKDGQNVRQIKKEVLKKAENLFKGEIELNKRKHGRREVRLILT
jgi:hypothetical protein